MTARDDAITEFQRAVGRPPTPDELIAVLDGMCANLHRLVSAGSVRRLPQHRVEPKPRRPQITDGEPA